MPNVGVTTQCIYCGRELEVEFEIPEGIPEETVEVEINMPCQECASGHGIPAMSTTEEGLQTAMFQQIGLSP